MLLHPVNQLSLPTDFRNKLWVGLGLGVGIGLSLYFWKVMLIQDQQNMLIQEHVLLGKITATVGRGSLLPRARTFHLTPARRPLLRHLFVVIPLVHSLGNSSEI